VQFAQSVGQAFLGLNLKCASCHDSFVDRWKLDESYGLAAVYADTPLEIHRCDKPLGRMARPSWLFPELGQVQADQPPKERLRQLATLMTHPENGRFTRTMVNRLWQRLMGRGLVHPTDAMQTEPWNVDLLDYLAMHLADTHYDLKKTLELICTSEAYQSQAQVVSKDADEHGYVYAGPRAKRLTAEQFVDGIWQLTGTAPARWDAPVKRGKGDPAVTNAPAGMVRASLMNSDLLQRALGRPNREQIVSMRPHDLTTLEAIDLNNGQILATRLEQGGQNLAARSWPSADALVRYVFTFALARPPTDGEMTLAREALGDKPAPNQVQDFLWAVCMLPEFHLVR
jgi:hypothetical protein